MRQFLFFFSIFLTPTFILLSQINISKVLLFQLFAAIITSVLIYFAIKAVTKNPLYALIASLIFASWIHTASPPILHSLLIIMIIANLFTLFTRFKKNILLFTAGVLLFSLFINSVHIGVAIFFVSLFYFFLSREIRDISSFLAFIYGLTWSSILFMIVQIANGSFIDIVNIIKPLYLLSFQIDSFLPEFSVALLLSIPAIYLLIMRNRFHLVFLSLLLPLFEVALIFSNGTVNNFRSLLALTGIPIALFLRFNISTVLRYVALLVSVIIFIIGILTLQ